MTLLAVNYHYVAEEAPRTPRAIFPVTVGGLGAQLEELGRRFELVSREQVLAAVDREGALPDPACLITFDDGLRVQYELALPVLERLGVPAVFFVPGRPLAEGKALYVHKVHRLREELGDEALAPLVDADSVPEDVAREQYAYDTPEAARVKYALNMRLPLDERDDAVAGLLARVVESEEAFCAELYMSRDQVRELERRGALGAHSYGHEPLGLLEPQHLRVDLEASAQTLEEVTGSRPRVLSYPHGSREAVTQAVAVAAERAGFRAGFTMERAVNRTLEQPLLLARIDANDAPGGSRPLSTIPDRTRYL
ncbi:MAG: polysaccharide deacetylase family protein [Actinomycetota bacterium]|nr:polysaccharide deacetylase family protein [Actinomycetota bacterium]